MKRFILVLLSILVTASQSMAGGITRQESTGQLKKVVYSGNYADCPQVVVNVQDNTYYWAKVLIPELTFANMPAISVFTNGEVFPYVPATNLWSGVHTAGYREGEYYIYWKRTNTNWGPDQNPQIYYTQFKIVVIYEPGLQVQNPGTGTSLRLEWNVGGEGEKIRGYKVWRREK
jgi:hypothetical protein